MGIDQAFLERRHLFLAGEAVVSRNEAAESPADAIERRDWLDFLTARLPARTRKMLRLYFVEGFTYVEIGRAFGLSPGRVNMIIFGAFNKVRCVEWREGERQRMERLAVG